MMSHGCAWPRKACMHALICQPCTLARTSIKSGMLLPTHHVACVLPEWRSSPQMLVHITDQDSVLLGVDRDTLTSLGAHCKQAKREAAVVLMSFACLRDSIIIHTLWPPHLC